MELAFHTYNNWTGSKVRGEEIAKRLGAKLNERGDINIHVKPLTLEGIPDGDWIDILDAKDLVPKLLLRPKLNAIAISQHSYNWLKTVLPNKLVWISQQHINWDREKKNEHDKLICGYIGAPSERARRHYENLSIENFVTCFDYKTREDCINFYKSIDVLIVSNLHREEPFKTPTKLINAASFGVPSIAVPLEGYSEWEHYTKFTDLAENLKNLVPAEKLIEEAEKYHIDNVAKKYEQLWT